MQVVTLEPTATYYDHKFIISITYLISSLAFFSSDVGVAVWLPTSSPLPFILFPLPCRLVLYQSLHYPPEDYCIAT